MSGEYISRDRIMSYLNDIWLSVTPNDFMPDEDIEFAKVRCEGIKDAMDAIESIPAADVVEVVHARPVKFYCDARTGRMITTCSACDLKIGPYDSFCKHCGAKMDGGQDE